MLEDLVPKLPAQTAAIVPFVAATLCHTTQNASQVNVAPERVAATVPRVAIVNEQGMTMSDSMHLDSASSDAMGMAMAKPTLEMMADPMLDAP